MPCERPYPPGMMPEPHGEAEFDAFASHYDAGMSDPFKRIIGGDADTFLEHKADWLLRTLAPSGRLLDFGCGNGRFLRALRRRGGLLDLAGYDASAGMIDAARRQWDSGPPPVLHHLAPSGQVPFADREFDMVTAVCVLHHIRPSSRLRVVREMARVLKSGGVLVIFEHNPLNPVTRWLCDGLPLTQRRYSSPRRSPRSYCARPVLSTAEPTTSSSSRRGGADSGGWNPSSRGCPLAGNT